MKLIFVYNADSGLFNGLADWAHKIFSPETYACNLCALTYSYTGMRREWRQFIARLDVPVEFLHRDELRTRYGIADMQLPAVLKESGGRLRVWLSAERLNGAKTLAELQTLISANLSG